MNFKISSNYHNLINKINEIINNFDGSGTDFIIGNRNIIKVFDVDNLKINVKSFKKPNVLNQIIYGYFRKSKAKRSYEFAEILLSKNIGTPKPIAFYEKTSFLGLQESFYLCEHLEDLFMFRDLVEFENYPDKNEILKQFTKFSFDLHQNGIEFLDHSPGNTLIKKNENGSYSFYLVDLNRMKFYDQMSFKMRMNNLKKLTPYKEMVEVISKEYSKLYDISENEIFDSLWQLTQNFQNKYYRKKALKKRLKFWKK